MQSVVSEETGTYDTEPLLGAKKAKSKPICKCCCKCCTKRVCACFSIGGFLVLAGLGVGFYLFFATTVYIPLPPLPDTSRPPDSPTGLTVVSRFYSDTTALIQLRWNASVDNGRIVQAYEVLLQSPTIGDRIITFPSRALQQNVTVLCDKFYNISIRASNAIGRSNFSDPLVNISSLPSGPPFVPGMPLPFATSASSLSVTWTPSTTQCTAVRAYELQRSVCGSADPNATCSDWGVVFSGDALKYTLEGLDSSMSHKFRVQAVDFNNDRSQFSAASPAYTADRPGATPPLQPPPVVASSLSSWYIALDWQRPYHGGAEILSYTLERSEGIAPQPSNLNPTAASGATTEEFLDSAGAPIEFPHTLHVPLAIPLDRPRGVFYEMNSSTAYWIRVRANNGRGAGVASTPVMAVTSNSTVPTSPIIEIYDYGASFISIRWDPVISRDGPVISYEIQADDWWERLSFLTRFTAEPDQLSYRFEDRGRRGFRGNGITPSSRYSLRVRANNRIGWSDWSNVVSQVTADQGRCGNSNDVPIYHELENTLSDIISECLANCVLRGQPPVCTSDCLTRAVGFTGPCGLCWEANGRCIMSNCFDCIFFPRGQPCRDCAERRCVPDNVICTGVPQWAHPA